MARGRSNNNPKSNGATLGFDATLWAAADKLRNNMAAAEPFEEKMQRLTAKLVEQLSESARLEKEIRANLQGLGYEV
jgi:hypothetical protein